MRGTGRRRKRRNRRIGVRMRLVRRKRTSSIRRRR